MPAAPRQLRCLGYPLTNTLLVAAPPRCVRRMFYCQCIKRRLAPCRSVAHWGSYSFDVVSKFHVPKSCDIGYNYFQLIEISCAFYTQFDREIKEREQYQSQIEHLKDALRLAQEGHNKATLLLEHRSQGAGDWENSLQMLKTQLANHEKHSRKEREENQNIPKRQIAQYKRAYDEEKSKSVWQKLFE